MTLRITVVLLIFSSVAWAANDRPLSSDAFKKLLDRYDKVDLKRGQFETSAEVSARLSGQFGERYIVDVPAAKFKTYSGSLHRSVLGAEYDADTEIMTFNLIGTSIGLRQFQERLTSKNHNSVAQIEIVRTEFPPKKYVGQNAYGAKAAVTQYSSLGYYLAFINMPTDKASDVISAFPVKMDRSKAQAALPRAIFRFEFEPAMVESATCVVFHTVIGGSATISDPMAIAHSERVLSARLRHLAVIDPRTEETFVELDGQ